MGKHLAVSEKFRNFATKLQNKVESREFRIVEQLYQD